MAPCILHHASSFSNLPSHRHHLSLFQEASGVSSRHEGLALLTTIAESGVSFTPANPPLQNQSPLSTSLISKIIHLIDALDLPCQRSYVALDQLLLDTLESLKIAYPKCLSVLSESHNTSSVQQGLVFLHEVLSLVQGFHAEHKQLGSSGSDKHTTTASQSFEQVGEHVIEMLDQVTPFAKEMFSSMESSKNSTAAWLEDLPGRRSLPPVLCRPRSPSSHEMAGGPTDGTVDVATSRKSGSTVGGMDQGKIQSAAEGSCSEHAGRSVASRCEPPPSTPTADYNALQATPLSVSPHPLSAPPPSPIPAEGLPMLLLCWEAMQDGSHAVLAMAAPPAAQPVDGTEGKDRRTTAGSTGEVQPAASAQKQSVVDDNAAAANAPPPLPHRGPSAELVETIENAPPPVAQGGPPPANGPSAPPPPPPGAGNIAKALRAKKAATKLKRSTQMGSMYRHLRDRVEGSCPHGAKSSQDKKARAAAAAAAAGWKSGGAGQGMADALAEMTKRSAYFRQIEEDVGNHATAILELKEAIASFQSKDMGELAKFHQHVEQQLASLADETQVLARFEDFPSKKLETLRMAAALYSKLDGVVSTLKGWKLQAAPVSPQLDRLEAYFNKVKDEVDTIERSKDEEMNRFQSHNVHFDLGVLVRIKECMVDLSSSCVELALKESQDANSSVAAPKNPSTGVSRMLWRVFQLAFRVYNFAGGQDERADRLTSTLAREIEAHPLPV
ncbi:hypothetical protein GUJ93_ZPchr0006g43012 [Zizania palustris]|uniref:Uncharacterized protein n=1 Tax=Zizania palustris TaxID=103762 RepID=A0A8J5SWE8_ZIZPA|nr:hypothetical protein GUJ93_ZPchr0006g43012 [Zizania palustris]